MAGLNAPMVQWHVTPAVAQADMAAIVLMFDLMY